ncbi:MAG: thioesterase [Acidobacteria bacterium]|nr:thioesterase [Acidobacteriota bacterium]
MTTFHHPQKDKWISPRDRIEGARVRLFCLPHAGSGAVTYQSWKRELPSFVEICALRLPGREMRLSERVNSNCRILSKDIAEAVAGECDLPYAIFGHSMGALLAFELARNLRDKGVSQPKLLFLSGRIGAHVALRTSPLHELPLDLFLAELEVRYGALPRELLEDREMLDFYLPILRADIKLVETYQYQTCNPLDCPIYVTAGEDDRSVWAEGLSAWKQHTTGDFGLTMYQGGHFYLSGDSRKPFMDHLRARLSAIATGSQ